MEQSIFSNISDYVTDPDIELLGVDLAFGKGRVITVRRAGGSNREFTNHVANQFKTFNDQNKGSSIDESDAAARKLMYLAYASKVVLGWQGFLGAGGEPIPFTVEACVQLFEASREIYEQLVEESNRLDNFRQQDTDDSGNE